MLIGVEATLVNLLGGVILLAITAASYRLHATDLWGSVSGFGMGLLIALTSGWAWVAVLIAFLALGSAATKYRYQFKLSIHAAEEKRGARGIRNVVANGAVAAAVSVLNFVRPSPEFAVLYVAAVASAAADTLATEIGLLSSHKPVMINRPSSTLAPGISGGVTLLGEGAALGGALAMALFGASVGVLHPPLPYLLLAAVGGFLGCNVDSLLGGSIQALYRCQVCGAATEKKVHCGQPSTWLKGVRAVGNNEVNLLSDLITALVVGAIAFAV